MGAAGGRTECERYRCLGGRAAWREGGNVEDARNSAECMWVRTVPDRPCGSSSCLRRERRGAAPEEARNWACEIATVSPRGSSLPEVMENLLIHHQFWGASGTGRCENGWHRKVTSHKTFILQESREGIH